MADLDDFMLALVDMRLQFKGADGSGLAGGELARWEEEYQRVKRAATAGVLITATQFEGGGSSSGTKQFDARVLMRAVLTRRAELDPAFDDVLFSPPAVKHRAERRGFVMQFA